MVKSASYGIVADWMILPNLTDYSGNSRTLTSVGSPSTVTDHLNRAGRALQFTRGSTASNYAYITNNGGITGGACTMMCWFKINSLPTSGNLDAMMCQMDATNDVAQFFYYQNNSGTYRWGFQRMNIGGASGVSYYNQTITTGVWYHVAYVYDGTNVRGYINGILSATNVAASGTGSGALDRMVIGAYTVDGTNYYSSPDGMIDSPVIYNRALSDSEILQEYLEGTQDYRGLFDGLVAGWDLRGSLLDYSGNSYTLTNNNSTGTTTDRFGNTAQAYSFVRASSRYLNYASALGITNGTITLSAWINPTDLPSSGAIYGILAKGNATNHVQYHTYLYNESGTQKLVFNRQRQNTVNDELKYTVTLSTGTWYHVVGTYDGANSRLYLNGTLVAGPTAYSGNGASGGVDDTVIGFSSQRLSGSYMNGSIGDTVILNTNLSDAQVLALYKLQSVKYIYPYVRGGRKCL